jgi:hypothetical protein
MKNRLEDLWKSAADDGASTPLGPLGCRTEAEFDQLLDAWFLERRNSIEFEMLLSQSRNLIARLLAEGSDSPGGRKKARRLLREIDRCFRAAKTGEG